MEDTVQIRMNGADSGPALIYLPGLHGDSTLIGPFRRALGTRVRLVEVTYPRTLTWSLDHYAAALSEALGREGIRDGWVLAESFSSQVAWRLLEAGTFAVRGLILAGGFVRHPMQWGIRVTERLLGSISSAMLVRILFGYARLARIRRRSSADMQREFAEFIARRTPLDQQAMKHRLHLLAESDPCRRAQNTSVPVYALSGLFDPIVPWWWVRPWLRKNCRALREFRVVWRSDHNVLSNAADEAAGYVIRWMDQGVSPHSKAVAKKPDRPPHPGPLPP